MTSKSSVPTLSTKSVLASAKTKQPTSGGTTSHSASPSDAKTHLSTAGGVFLTPDEVTNTPGTALTPDELKRLQTAGTVPKGINLAMHPSMHKIKAGQDEYLVLMVDAPPCGCRKVNGKKERCRQHRVTRRTKKRGKKAKKAKDGIKDDDSDRKKLGALRHAEDSEEEGDQPIPDALTPDMVCIVGPAGTAVLVSINVADNPNAGPMVKANEFMQPVRGILVMGPQDVPQIIPEDKIPKDEKGEPKFAHFTRGTLVRNARGEHIFFPDGGCKWDDKGNALNMECPGADPNVGKEIGDKLHVAGMVDINESGMPIFRQIDEKNPTPQDKLATIGVIATVDGQNIFVQTKGQTVGSGDNAPVIATTREGAVPVGTVLGEAVYNKNNGKVEVVLPGQTNGQEVVGTVVQGNYNQPVLIPVKGSRLDKDSCVAYDTTKAKAMTAGDWQKLLHSNEDQQKQAAPAIENNNVAVASFMTGESPDAIRKKMEEAKKNPDEVISMSFAAGYCPNRSIFAYKGAAGGGAGGAAGGGGGGPASAEGAGGAGGVVYQNGEVKSTAFSYGQGAAARSVFMK